MFKFDLPTANDLHPKEEEDRTIVGAIETIFQFEDKVILHWGESQLYISLRYDISDSWFDIKGLMDNINSPKTSFDFTWPSQTFFGYWKIETHNQEEWIIHADWSYETAPSLKVSKKDFKQAWLALIEFVEDKLKQQGYDVVNMPIH